MWVHILHHTASRTDSASSRRSSQRGLDEVADGPDPNLWWRGNFRSGGHSLGVLVTNVTPTSTYDMDRWLSFFASCPWMHLMARLERLCFETRLVACEWIDWPRELIDVRHSKRIFDLLIQSECESIRIAHFLPAHGEY